MQPSSCRWTTFVLGCFYLLASVCCERSFRIENNRFVRDGEPIQIFSGSIHYQRIHPEYWRDRLLRVKALGLNAIQLYTTWNLHEPEPGVYTWEGFGDVERFLRIANELDLLVFLRPGPYACGEWEFGGFPAWLGSKYVDGGGTMTLRVSDEQYLRHVDRWWSELLPRFTKHLYKNGGPIIMAQIENEYGFCWRSPDRKYLQFLVDKIHQYLDDDVIIYSTDPPWVMKNGTIPGPSVFSVVDFGPGTNVDYAFSQQAKQNPPNKSAPLNSEYYTGWITTWGEKMANTSADATLKTLNEIVSYANNTGSVNLYMAHGGTNFGYWAGANLQSADPTPPSLASAHNSFASQAQGQDPAYNGQKADIYKPTMTSYDYDCPVSESGRTGQPGIGGPNKFELIREVFSKASGNRPIDFPEPIPVQDYGTVTLGESVSLLDALGDLIPGEGIYSETPERMENYNQSGGITIYRTYLPRSEFGDSDAVLDIGGPVHDYAQVLLNGKVTGVLERNIPKNLTLSLPETKDGSKEVQLDIVLHAMGRVNFGCIWDLKGLVHGKVFFNGKPLTGWRVFPVDFSNIQDVKYPPQPSGVSRDDESSAAKLSPSKSGPVLYRGQFHVDGLKRSYTGHVPDTYISVRRWHKGLAFINGFNLGWYWPRVGPQGAQYIPGPLLRSGLNELVLVEVEDAPLQNGDRVSPTVHLTDKADFAGANQEVRESRDVDISVSISR